MSTERESILIVGWVGQLASMVDVFTPLADKLGLEVDEDLVYNIGEDYDTIFNKEVSKNQLLVKNGVELVHGTNGSESGSIYLGLVVNVHGLSRGDFLAITTEVSQIMMNIAEKYNIETEPRFYNVISWY